MNQDTKKALITHRNLIKSKKFLHKIYLDFYQLFKDISYPKGPIIELGSGGGFIKDVFPEVITSDLLEAPGIDQIFAADKIPYKKNSVSGFLMIDVLHHIKDPEKSFREMSDKLKIGGKIIMIEPYNSRLWGYFIFKFIHPEKFNPKSGWTTPGNGRMSDSNTAIPWIIFTRDRKLFSKKFPELRINKVYPHTPFRYLISGGLTRFQFAPTSSFNLITKLEGLLSPLREYLGMFVLIEVEKIKS